MQKRVQSWENDQIKNTELACSVIKHLLVRSPIKWHYKAYGAKPILYSAQCLNKNILVCISRSAGKIKDFTKEQWLLQEFKWNRSTQPKSSLAEMMQYRCLYGAKKNRWQEALYHPWEEEKFYVKWRTYFHNKYNNNERFEGSFWSSETGYQKKTAYERLFLITNLNKYQYWDIGENRMISKKIQKKLQRHLESIGRLNSVRPF